ncbi:MAG TPA: long-chain-acyl-CoA synthetase [bacterium]|nr:long-chain-acyl-CoA synthetase [bacterium]
MIINKAEAKVAVRLNVALYRLLKGECCSYRLVEKWARLIPERPAVYFQDGIMTWRELNALTNKVANHFLSQGGKDGDVVAVFMENCPEYLGLLAGLNKIGMVASLINTHLRQKPLAHALIICNPRWIVASEELVQALEDVIAEAPVGKEAVWVWDGQAPPGYEERDLSRPIAAASDAAPAKVKKPKFDDHVLNIYTSGTTGLPKAARVSNRRVFFSGYALGYALARFASEDCIYVPLPLYHSIGMFVGWGSALATGAAIGIRRRFSASEFFTEAKKFHATGATFIGEMPRYLLAQPPSPHERDHGIRRVITVGLRGNVWETFQQRFGIEQVFEFYGATETSVGIMNVEGKPGMLGRLMPLQAYVVKWDKDSETIVHNEKGRCINCEPGEEGMLIGRINSIFNVLGFDGYVDDEATRSKLIKGVFSSWDEFFVTGDVVKVHDDRWVSFVDRSGDTFRWKGENVATKEVEIVLDGCPAVGDVNVYGVKVPGQEGAAGMAAVVVDGEWDCECVSKYVVENLPHYARPLFVRLCPELPMTVTLKHQKFGLRSEGFDPAKIKDPIYFWDRRQQSYKLLDEDTYADIVGGNVKL